MTDITSSPAAAKATETPATGTGAGLTAEVLGSGAGTTGVITLDRPKVLNALNLDMIRMFADALDRFAADTTVRQVLVRSASPRAFCSGGDVRSVRETDLAGDTGTGDAFFAGEYDVNHRLATFPVPVVALVDGITMGGGMGVSMHSAYRVITRKAWASMPEAAIGFVTDVGISHVFTHLPALATPENPSLALGLWLATTAYRLTPGDLLWTGLATHLTQDAASFTTRLLTDGLAAALASAEVPVHARPDSALAAMADEIGELYAGEEWRVIDARLRDADGTEGTVALTRELLAPANPLSLEAMTRLLAYSARHSLREALDAEFTVGTWARRQPNFPEGVRAVLVDKTRDAAFVPASTAQVTDADRAGIDDALAAAVEISAGR